jgi:hypothetical protein
VSHFLNVTLNRQNWLDSCCTCFGYFKTYMRIHIMSEAVSTELVKVPNHCKLMVTVGIKPKRGRKTNPSKGLSK